MPDSLEYYIHRIGRTGRAGATGLAISLVTEADQAIFPELVDYLKQKNQKIPMELERHKAVREAAEVSKFKGDEEQAPTEFKMILTVWIKHAISYNVTWPS
jgi:pre-mRNA-splicing ATP-dependent RNA helicase PRP28